MTLTHRLILFFALGLPLASCQAIASVDYALVDGATCAPGQELCAGQCWDLQTSQAHCGQCNKNCAVLGRVCSNGSCACPPGSMQCGSSCRPTLADPLNCGACGRVCATTEQCVNGFCQACPAGELSCSNICIDLQTNPVNCGACGRTCAGGFCTQGMCPEDLPACPAPSTDVGADGEKVCGDSVCRRTERCCFGALFYCAADCGADLPAACDGPEDCATGEVCCGVFNATALTYVELVCKPAQECTGNSICHPALSGQCNVSCEQSTKLPCGYGLCAAP